MVYRKICTYAGNDILERLPEEELAAYYRNKRCQRKKWERKTEIGALGAGIIGVAFPLFLTVVYVLMG